MRTTVEKYSPRSPGRCMCSKKQDSPGKLLQEGESLACQDMGFAHRSVARILQPLSDVPCEKNMFLFLQKLLSLPPNISPAPHKVTALAFPLLTCKTIPA